ncbi:MAG: radical SAM protein [Acidimicrobiales bacterium]
MRVHSLLRRKGSTAEPDTSPASRDASSTWCQAPSSALYFAPDGSVRPCCAGGVPIGWVTGPNRTSLGDLWRGPRAEQIRAAVAVGDLSLGCAECAVTASSSDRGASLAVHFDRWAGHDGAWPRDLEFALSNTCNLQCVMCNGDLSSAIRSQREHRSPLPAAYDDRFFEELAEFLPHAQRVAFKGGEPFLAREAGRVMDMLLDIGSTAEVKVTTNGTVWSDRVERIMWDLRVSPILSVDAMDPTLLARLRAGIDPEQFWHNVDRFQEVTSSTDAGITFSYCLMRSNWQELAPLITEAGRRRAWIDIAYVVQPSDHTLFGLGAELDSVLAAMEAQGDQLEPANDHLAQAWERALDWVRYCRTAAGPPAVAVTLALRASRDPSVPVSDPGPDPSLLDELRTWAGAEPLVLTARQGEIVEVSIPDWAAGWHPMAWVGASVVDLPVLLAGVLDRTLTSVLSEDLRGATLAVLVDDAGRDVVRAVVHGRSEMETIYLAPTAAPSDPS